MGSDEKQPPHRGIKKGLYVIPTLFTAANVAMGFLAVLTSIRGYHASFTDTAAAAQYFDLAAMAIGLAILFDTVDGRVASATRTATEIGVQFDSLADVLTFGIAPTALIYSWAIGPSFSENTPGHGLGVFLLFMYLMCGAFRLARFNIQATRPRVLTEGTPKLDKKYFVGLPIPPAGGLLAAVVHFAPTPLNSYGEATARHTAYPLMGLVAFLGIMMITTIRHSSMKTAAKGRQAFYLVLFLMAVAMLIYLYSQYVLLALAAVYVFHGLIWWILRSMARLVRPSASST